MYSQIDLQNAFNKLDNEKIIEIINSNSELDFNITSNKTPLLMHLLKYKYYEAAKLILSISTINQVNADGLTALHQAVLANDITAFNILLSCEHLDVNAVDKLKRTPINLIFDLLRYQDNSTLEDFARSLIETEAEIETKNTLGNSCLDIIFTYDDVDHLKLIINHAIHRDGLFSQKSHANLLDRAITSHKSKIINYLAPYFDIEELWYSNHKLSIKILSCNLIDQPQEIIERLFVTDLAIGVYPEDCKILLDKGADINAVDENGDPFIFSAIRNKKYGLVKFLIDNNANLNIKDSSGKTYTLLEAVKNFNHRIISLLIKNRAYIEVSSVAEKDVITQLIINRHFDEAEFAYDLFTSQLDKSITNPDTSTSRANRVNNFLLQFDKLSMKSHQYILMINLDRFYYLANSLTEKIIKYFLNTACEINPKDLVSHLNKYYNDHKDDILKNLGNHPIKFLYNNIEDKELVKTIINDFIEYCIDNDKKSKLRDALEYNSIFLTEDQLATIAGYDPEFVELVNETDKVLLIPDYQPTIPNMRDSLYSSIFHFRKKHYLNNIFKYHINIKALIDKFENTELVGFSDYAESLKRPISQKDLILLSLFDIKINDEGDSFINGNECHLDLEYSIFLANSSHTDDSEQSLAPRTKFIKDNFLHNAYALSDFVKHILKHNSDNLDEVLNLLNSLIDELPAECKKNSRHSLKTENKTTDEREVLYKLNDYYISLKTATEEVISFQKGRTITDNIFENNTNFKPTLETYYLQEYVNSSTPNNKILLPDLIYILQENHIIDDYNEALLGASSLFDDDNEF